MSLKIHGNLNPTVGKAESYTIKALFDMPSIINPFVSPIDNKVKWCIYVLENGKWRKTKENEKTGETVSYTFTEKSLSRKGIKIEAQRGFETASEIIKPQRAQEQKILKVELLDAQENKLTKPLSYGQTVVAKATCTGLDFDVINFTLWEDDAKGAGHSSTNKNNKAITKPAEVKKGIAKASFKLMPSFDKMAKAFQTAGGEGKLHEYYVTASIQDKLSASNNIDVKALEEPIPPVKKKVPVQDPQKPKPNAPTTAPKQPSVKKGVTKVTLTKTSQTTLSCVVFSNGLQGKEIKFKLYEHDYESPNDLLIDQKFAINSDSFVINIDLKKVSQSAGGGFWQEGNEQELFVDIEVIETASHHKTGTIDVDITAFGTDPVDDTNKMVKVGVEEKKKKEIGGCVCKEDYKDLIWGNKVSCEFRKKVVEIAKRLGKEPNLLMAGMALETGRTFSPTAGKGTSYVGLIQFGDDAAESVGTTRADLLKMTALEQLDYVEKYLKKKNDKIKTLTDFYLSILMPVDVGKGNEPNHVVFDNEYPLKYKKDGKTLTDLSKSRHYGYRQNPAFYFEDGEKTKVKNGGGKKYDGSGKTYIWEIEKFLSNIYEEGKLNKVKTFACNKKEIAKPSIESGTWNVVITEKYTGNNCEHEKPRKNCRRGKIDVYDHNKKLVFTVSDCLLEGVAGEDRMKTNSDAPFGTYAISSTPFIMGANSGQKRISYGPNPRLSFEPINGSGDEADKSNRSLIRIHGGRQEDKTTYQPLSNPVLKRTQGCIRVYDTDAKDFYDWWVKFHKANPNVKPGKLKIVK